MNDIELTSDTINSLMGLVGGTLSFIAVLAGIIQVKFEKAKNATARERLVSGLFSISAIAATSTGSAMFLLGFERVSLLLFGVGRKLLPFILKD